MVNKLLGFVMFDCFRVYHLRYAPGFWAVVIFILICRAALAADNANLIDVNVPETYLKAPLLSEQPNLDPSASWEFENSFILSALYDSLYKFTKKGKVVPNVASSLPNVSSNGKKQTIFINPNAIFNDDPCFEGGKGRPVTASDVIFSIKRIADPENESGLWALIAGYIEGLDDFRKRLESKSGTLSEPVKGLAAKSETEIEIRLVKPLNQLVYILGMTEFGIVPPEAEQKYGKSLSTHPVGTGPFKFRHYSRKKVILQRRPNPWRIPPSDKGALPDGIDFSFYDDAFSAFRSGNLDLVLVPPNRLTSYVNKAFKTKKDLKEKGYGICKIESPANYYLLFNYENELLHNISLREAISFAIPWDIIVDKTDLSHACFVPRGVLGHVDLKHHWNLEKAREALRKAGYPGGRGLPELIIRFSDYGIMLRHAGMIQDSLKAAGIRTRINYSEEVIEGADIGFYGWLMDYADAENFLVHLNSRAFPPTGENYGHHSNKTYDDLLEMASQTTGQNRVSIYQKAAYLIYETVAAIPFRQPVEYWALGPRIAYIDYASGLIDWSSIRFVPNSGKN